MQPILKWAGGKRWLISNYKSLFPTQYNRYIEPFLGGGSLYFHLKPRQALLGDSNRELINTYQCIRDDWKLVWTILEQHQTHHGETYYYTVRDNEFHEPVEQAARLIYLNRTCFNGIYRVNRNGRFNVPKGTKDKVIFENDDFESLAALLSQAELVANDFEHLVNAAQEGDFVFADPPYTVKHNQNGFIKYNENLFHWEDQIRLADALTRARDRGAKVICTNANHEAIHQLYKERGFYRKVVSRYSSMAANPEKRNRYEELIILSENKPL